MKRIIVWLLAILLLLTACRNPAAPKVDSPFTLYFPKQDYSAENGIFSTVTVSLNASEQTLDEIILTYMNTAPPQGASEAIPKAWTLHSAQKDASVAVLSFHGTQVSSTRLSLAGACLTKTLTQIDGIDAIELYAPSLETPLRLSVGDILFEDTAMQPQEESIVLYLPDVPHRYLLRQTKTVEAMDAGEKPKYILQSLLDTSYANSCIPKSTRLLGVSLENEICTVNLSSEFVQNMERNFACETLAIYSIVNSLTELPEISTVDFWIEGAPLENLTFMQLHSSLERNERLINTSGTAIADTTLYLPCSTGQLVCVPYLLAPQQDIELSEAVFRALIQFSGENGIKNPIPSGTKLLSLRMEGSACIIDLTGEFLSGSTTAQQELLAVRSIVATMCSVSSITSVEILVEGLEPSYRNEALKNLRSPTLEWFAE